MEDLNESSDEDSDEVDKIDLNDVEQPNPNNKDEDELETEDDNQEEEDEEEDVEEDDEEEDKDEEEDDDEEENANLTLPQSEDDSLMKNGEDLDPFSAHFELNLSEEQSRFMKDPAWKVEQFKYPTLGKIQVLILYWVEGAIIDLSRGSIDQTKKNFVIIGYVFISIPFFNTITE